MNANLIRYGIIAGAVLGAVGIGFGGYKGAKAMRRRSAEKRAAAKNAAAAQPTAGAANADAAAAAA
jgi:hypothetical protein